MGARFLKTWLPLTTLSRGPGPTQVEEDRSCITWSLRPDEGVPIWAGCVVALSYDRLLLLWFPVAISGSLLAFILGNTRIPFHIILFLSSPLSQSLWHLRTCRCTRGAENDVKHNKNTMPPSSHQSPSHCPAPQPQEVAPVTCSSVRVSYSSHHSVERRCIHSSMSLHFPLPDAPSVFLVT